MFSAPIDFNRQDEGHTAHNPLSWKVIETYYSIYGHYPYKYYNNTIVLTGSLAGTQSNNKENVIKHFTKIKDNITLQKLKYQKKWW
jgi:hypothetical protein